MTWFLSDTHFNSENIIRYCNRPFKDAAEMEKMLIYNWNANVKPEDDVYVVGDFIMGSDIESIPRILNQLNGKIHLIRGNHDTRRKLAIYEQFPDKIVEIKDIAYITYKGLFFIVCHFPITDEAFMDMVLKDNSEVVVVHGHVHDKAPFFTEATHSFNVSVDATGFLPRTIDEMHRLVRNHYQRLGVWGENKAEG